MIELGDIVTLYSLRNGYEYATNQIGYYQIVELDEKKARMIRLDYSSYGRVTFAEEYEDGELDDEVSFSSAVDEMYTVPRDVLEKENVKWLFYSMKSRYEVVDVEFGELKKKRQFLTKINDEEVENHFIQLYTGSVESMYKYEKYDRTPVQGFREVKY